MQVIYFTIACVVLYLLASRIVDWAEHRAGRRFEYRSVYFFTLLLVMALASFELIRRYA